ncbi:MAG: hypothetical protein CM15mP65_07940 [Crocinitomicaceae bacterium]|nr:MAG: hypothetical protein CM15mP65_07940 [Crocinitomicaceae bacterium]
MKKILFKLIMPLSLIISCSGLKKIEKQLQGNWILTSVNNQPIELNQNTPTVQFEAAKKQYLAQMVVTNTEVHLRWNPKMKFV